MVQHFLVKFLIQARHVLVLISRTLLSFTRFSHEFLVHMNENVSFQHVAF